MTARQADPKVLAPFENGVKAGETNPIAPRALARPWGAEPIRRPFMPSKAVLRALEQLEEEEAAEVVIGSEVGDTVGIAGSKTTTRVVRRRDRRRRARVH